MTLAAVQVPVDEPGGYFDMNQIFKVITIAVVSMVISIMFTFDATSGCPDMPYKLFFYNQKDILSYIHKKGYPDFNIDEIRRNSLGTSIYCYNYYRPTKDTVILSLSQDGKITKLSPPARFAYLDNNKKFVAWIDDNNKGYVRFINGKTVYSPVLGKIFSSFEIDPGGTYYFIKPDKDKINVASVEHPEKILFSATIQAEKIFYYDNKIYIFGRDYTNDNNSSRYKQDSVTCLVYSMREGGYEQTEKIRINRTSPRSSPFGVIDFDPVLQKVLLQDVRDMPFAFMTSWMVFDFKTEKLEKIQCSKDIGIFLANDFFKN